MRNILLIIFLLSLPTGAIFSAQITRHFSSLHHRITSADCITLHPSPFTLHSSPSTLHRSPFTLHPSPFTIPPSPFTLNHSRLIRVGLHEYITIKYRFHQIH